MGVEVKLQGSFCFAAEYVIEVSSLLQRQEDEACGGDVKWWRAYFYWTAEIRKISPERFTVPLQRWSMIVPCRSKKEGRNPQLQAGKEKEQSQEGAPEIPINLLIIPLVPEMALVFV